MLDVCNEYFALYVFNLHVLLMVASTRHSPWTHSPPIAGRKKGSSSCTKEAPKRKIPHHKRKISGPTRQAATRSQKTAHGCKESSLFPAEFSHRACRQHRDLHPRGSNPALKTECCRVPFLDKMLVQFVTYLVIFVSFSPLNMPLLLCSLCHKHSGMLLISSEFAELTARTTSFVFIVWLTISYNG